jgi:hypothetical protein
MSHMVLAGMLVVGLLGCQAILGYILVRADVDL